MYGGGTKSSDLLQPFGSAARRGCQFEPVIGIFKNFQDLITGNLGENPDSEKLGKLAVFAGVQEFPVRVKCASLAWHTMKAALDEKEKKVQTE